MIARLFAPLAAAALLACCHATPADPSITVTTARGAVHRFHASVARTAAEQARGLAGRAGLAPDAAMLFPIDPPRALSLWMKDTRMPLDMVFVGADGRIARIAPDRPPYSLAPVESGGVVAAVIEIGGGRAAALGIVAGDRVTLPPR